MELISYAQNFEDIRLWRAFRDVEKGRYLDIGTQGPTKDSVSRLFYDHGWRGVHVEPTPFYAAAMRNGRPDEQVIEAAVSASPVPLTFFEIPETGLSTGISEIAKIHENAGWSVNEIVVPTVTLASLLDFMGLEPIHWLKIDVEGMEADVLASWGDHPARPAALVIEATLPNSQEPTHFAWHAMVTDRGYREVAFDGLSRYFIHETHEHRGEALSLSPNVFDEFQILRTHFSAVRLAAETEQAIAHLRSEAEVLARDHAEQLVLVTEEASAQLNSVLQRTAELEERLASDAEAQAQAIAQARAEAAEISADLDATSAQRDAALARVDELEAQLASDAEAQAQAIAQARAEAAEISADLDATLTKLHAALARSDKFEAQLTSDAAAHAAELSNARSVAADTLVKLEAALRESAELANRLATTNADHATEMAKATKAFAEVSTKLEVARTHARSLEVRLKEQARQHASDLRKAESRVVSAQRALAETKEKLAGVQIEQVNLGRLTGQLEDKLSEQETRHSAEIAEAASQRAKLQACLDQSEEELAGLKDLAAELRADLAVEVARGQSAAVAASAEKKATKAKLTHVGRQVLRLTEQNLRLKTSLAASDERALYSKEQVADLSEKLDASGKQALNLTRQVIELTASLASSQAEARSLVDEVDELTKKFAVAEEQVLHLSSQAAQLAEGLAATSEQRDGYAIQAQLLTEARDNLAQELDGARRELSDVEAALRVEIAGLNAALSERDKKLAEAQQLLATTPDIMIGASSLRQVIARWALSANRLSAMADFQAAAAVWQQEMPLAAWRGEKIDKAESTLDCATQPTHWPPTNSGARMVTDDRPVTSLAQLLSLHDAAFVHAAYWSVLQRAPDMEGQSYYLTRLRTGVHKLVILRQLRHSPEGRTITPLVGSLDRAIRRHQWANLPLIGVFIRWLLAAEVDSFQMKQLRAISNDLGAAKTDLERQGELTGQLLDAFSAQANELSAIRSDQEQQGERTAKILDSLNAFAKNLELQAPNHKRPDQEAEHCNQLPAESKDCPSGFQDAKDKLFSSSPDEDELDIMPSYSNEAVNTLREILAEGSPT